MPFSTVIIRSYARAALCQEQSAGSDTLSRATASANSDNANQPPLPPPPPPLLLEAGDRVQLALGWEKCDDAPKGPLRPGEVRGMEKDYHSRART